MKNTDSPGSLALKLIFSIIAYMAFLLLNNYRKFGLTDEALFNFLPNRNSLEKYPRNFCIYSAYCEKRAPN